MTLSDAKDFLWSQDLDSKLKSELASVLDLPLEKVENGILKKCGDTTLWSFKDELLKKLRKIEQKEIIKPEVKDLDQPIITRIPISKLKDEDLRLFLLNNPIYYDENQFWWAWDNLRKCWKLVDNVDILNLVEDFFSIDTSKLTSQSTFLLKVLHQKSRRKKPKELPDYCIQFKNKIVNLRDGSEMEASPKFFTITPIPYELSDLEHTPTIDHLFTQWVGEKYKINLYEILAYACLNKQFLQTLFFLTGSGSNGKGSFQKLLIKFLGQENCASSSIKNLISRTFETSALYKKLLCLMGEVDSYDLKNTNLLKELSGEDLIRYEFKGKTSFSEKSPTTFIIATNSLPRTPDRSDGFFRRTLVIDFPNQFKVKRDLLSEIPEEEFHNLTRKVVNIGKKLLQQNEFTNAGTIEDKRRRYEERSNPLMMFISENFQEGGTDFIKLREFYTGFIDYLETKKLRQESISKVGKLLRDEGFEIQSRDIRDEFGKIIDKAKSIISLRRIEKNSSLGSYEKEKTTQTTKISYSPALKIEEETIEGYTNSTNTTNSTNPPIKEEVVSDDQT